MHSRNRVRFSVLAVLLAATLGLAAQRAAAQEKFPDRPITVIVPTAPGGGTDFAIRLLADLAGDILGQKMVVQNRSGATGIIGVAAVVRAQPNGYTLGGVFNGPLTMSPHSLVAPYKPEDYATVTLADGAPITLCTKASFPASNGKELIELLRKEPDKYTYGNDGVGGVVQLAAERVFSRLGVKARAIPFSGSGETLKNFLGGQIDIYGGAVAAIVPYVNSGAVKCLIVTGDKPVADLPHASTLPELGVTGAETEVWHGIIAPKGVPADRLAVLESAFRKAAESERFRAAMKQQSLAVEATSAEEMRKRVDSEYRAMGEIAQKLGLVQK
jgi:tripartite-type tricarboxylate transporter receptor subunit TctC